MSNLKTNLPLLSIVELETDGGVRRINLANSEDHLVSSAFKPCMKQNALFLSAFTDTKLTAMAQDARALILLFTSLEADVSWGLWRLSMGLESEWRFWTKDRG